VSSMKIKITKSALMNGLHMVQNVVGVRSTLPVLSNVLLSTEDDKLWLTTTDLDVTVRCSVEAQVLKGGITTLPVRRLSGIVRELPDAMIELSAADNDVMTLECGASFFKIIGMSHEEFPAVSNPEDKFFYQMDQGVFREMLRKTAYAASTDETRFVLNGVFLSFRDGKLVIVATDGRRLAMIENEVDFPDEAQADMILPSKAVQELLHILGDEGELKIFSRENQVVFEFGDVFMATKLIDGTYPNYRQVVPTQCEQRVTVEREILLAGLKRAALLATDRMGASKLTFADNSLIVSTNTPDVGEARETIAIRYSGKPISVAFNVEFLMDPLRNLTSDEIVIELTDDVSPGVVKCDIPFLYVLMPMRLS
jgi:DNA polymerase III subunit beta